MNVFLFISVVYLNEFFNNSNNIDYNVTEK